MTDGLKDAHREAIIAVIAANDRVERAVLFGSRATGTNTVTSDVDIALFGDRLTWTDQARLAAAIDQIPMAQSVDLLLYHSIGDRKLREHVRDHGVEWYTRSGHHAINCDGSSTSTGWKEAVLGDVVRLLSGGTPSKKREEYWNGAIPWVSARDMRQFRLRETTHHVTAEGVANGTRQVPVGTILLLTRGMRLLKELPVCVIERPMAFNQDIKALLPKARVDPSFLPYLVLGNKQRLLNLVDLAGHGTGRINTDELRALDVRLPPTSEQRAIAHVLGTLDDKIELNRRTNETLETMARTLYKSWFVDFDPVRAKMEGRDTGLPNHLARLFPNRLVDSELGKIPEDWEVSTLGNVIELHDRKRIPLNKRQRAERKGPYPYYGAAGIMDHVDGYLFDGVYVLMGEDGSVVDAHGCPVVQYVWGRFWVNNHAHVLKARDEISDDYLYLLLRQTNITAFVTGAVQPKLNQRNLKAIPLVLPSRSACRAFSDGIAALFGRMRHNTEENRTLAVLRDTLLPKLISGEIRVPEWGRKLETVT